MKSLQAEYCKHSIQGGHTLPTLAVSKLAPSSTNTTPWRWAASARASSASGGGSSPPTMRGAVVNSQASTRPSAAPHQIRKSRLLLHLAAASCLWQCGLNLSGVVTPVRLW